MSYILSHLYIPIDKKFFGNKNNHEKENREEKKEVLRYKIILPIGTKYLIYIRKKIYS